MYVCICRAVTDRKIKEAVCGGACCLNDLKQDLGVATCCGKCACNATNLIQEVLSKQQK
jgi:bacterioferritin-associated ferredoxin